MADNIIYLTDTPLLLYEFLMYSTVNSAPPTVLGTQPVILHLDAHAHV